MNKSCIQSLKEELSALNAKGNLRTLPDIFPESKIITKDKKKMINLSSNDYLGIAADINLRKKFLKELTPESFIPSASSSRLLTGNHPLYNKLENQLCHLFKSESALVFNSGYHMNTGILPAISNKHTLILADKLVHASLIDGIRLANASFLRYKHNKPEDLERLINKYHNDYQQIIVVTESIFSMDGDETDLKKLVEIKKQFSNVLLYVDEAHAIGVRGKKGLGCAEEYDCIEDIDFLTGTLGKALASVGGYIICKEAIRDYLINKMRTLIFTTALPPINLMWSYFVLERLTQLNKERDHLSSTGNLLRNKLKEKGFDCPSTSHIIPVILGDSKKTVLKAKELQQMGFYLLAVRPPTVAEGTSRIRISLTANIETEDIENLLEAL